MSKSVSKPLVSIVVLNWNGLEDTKQCLASLKRLKYPNKEIIVVDNGSSDGSKEYLSNIKDIVYIDLPKNTGFTGGHIEGFKSANGKYIALLNNDAVVASDWLTELVKVFDKYSDAAAVGSKSYMWTDEYQAFNSANPFHSYQEVDSNQGYTKTLMTGEDECAVDSISGAALVVDKDKLTSTGYLDNDFFAYYEETDLLARLKRHGYNAYYCPTAHIWHKIAGSSEGGESSRFYLYQMHRNRFYFAYKNFDEPNLKRFISSYKREITKARIKKLKHKNNDIEATARLEAYGDIKKNLPVLRKKRKDVLKLGESYNQTLFQHFPDDVTIIIPCYNYENYVTEAINSALKQSHSPKKIIIINDGSTDRSMSKINRFKDNPLVEVVDKENEGVIATKNLGINLSKTYWTMFLDADDILDEDALKIMLRSIKDDGLVDVIYSDMKLFGAVSDVFKARPFQAHTFLMQNYINNTTLINTTNLKRTSGYKQQMKDGLEDWELYITLFEQGARFRYIPQSLVWYRQHGQDVISRNTEVQDIEKGRRLYNTIRSIHASLYTKYGKRQRIIRLITQLIYLPLKHPGIFLVVARSLPGAFKQSIRHILHNVRIYLHSR